MRFELGLDDLASLRFGISPGNELCHAVRALLRPHSFPLQWGWLEQVRARPASKEFALLADVIGADGYMPDFFSTTPAGEWTAADELRALRNVPEKYLRRDLGKMVVRSRGARRERLQALVANPRAARRDIAAWWSVVWDQLLAPYWPQLLQMARADVGVRSRRSADDGIAAMVDSLHPTIRWHGTSVVAATRYFSGTIDCSGSGLLLVPSIMMESDRCAIVGDPPATPAVFYPALGVQPTWYHSGRPADRTLGRLLGATRGRLLRLCARPVTTGQAAEAGELAPATASHHLSVLREAGLIDSTRHGKTVVHTVTPLGQALLTAQ